MAILEITRLGSTARSIAGRIRAANGLLQRKSIADIAANFGYDAKRSEHKLKRFSKARVE
jgi:hypothetical protein